MNLSAVMGVMFLGSILFLALLFCVALYFLRGKILAAVLGNDIASVMLGSMDASMEGEGSEAKPALEKLAYDQVLLENAQRVNSSQIDALHEAVSKAYEYIRLSTRQVVGLGQEVAKVRNQVDELEVELASPRAGQKRPRSEENADAADDVVPDIFVTHTVRPMTEVEEVSTTAEQPEPEVKRSSKDGIEAESTADAEDSSSAPISETDASFQVPVEAVGIAQADNVPAPVVTPNPSETGHDESTPAVAVETPAVVAAPSTVAPPLKPTTTTTTSNKPGNGSKKAQKKQVNDGPTGV